MGAGKLFPYFRWLARSLAHRPTVQQGTLTGHECSSHVIYHQPHDWSEKPKSRGKNAMMARGDACGRAQGEGAASFKNSGMY